LISYELILSSAILLVIFLTSNLNLTVNIEYQKIIWFIIPLFPVFIIFFIGSIAETNRAPFDLAEAESELVSGFMTEHAAVIFVFFFLAEYASIVLICILTSILFIGGYIMNLLPVIHMLHIIDIIILFIYEIQFSVDIYNLTNYFYFDNTMLKVILSIPIRYTVENYEPYMVYIAGDPFLQGIISSLVLGIKSCIMIFVFI